MERSMTAQERSRWLEQLAIQEAALDLTLEKGYRGFTMDELAQRTGMPRRTLFQRVGDKMSAVMGVEDDPRPVESVTPDPALPPFDAYVATALRLIDEVQIDESVLAIHAKYRQAIAQEPRLAAESARRTERNLEAAADALRAQHGWAPDDPRPVVLSRVMSALLEEAIARVLAAQEQGDPLDVGQELRRLTETLKSLI